MFQFEGAKPTKAPLRGDGIGASHCKNSKPVLTWLPLKIVLFTSMASVGVVVGFVNDFNRSKWKIIDALQRVAKNVIFSKGFILAVFDIGC